MSRETVLNRILDAKGPIEKLENIREEFWNYHSPTFDLGKIPMPIKVIILFFPFLIIMAIFLELIEIFNPDSLPLLILPSIFLTLVLINITYTIIVNKANSFQVNKKISGNSQRIRDIQKEEENILNHLETLHLPADFLYSSAISTFESYVRNYRADSIKECVNLYIQETQHSEKVQEIRTMQEIQRATYEEARSTKQIALLDLILKR